MSRAWLLVGFLFCGVTARADVTVRSSAEIKTSSLLPTEAAETLKKQMPNMAGSSTTMYLKGNRALITQGDSQFLSDFDGALVTLLNSRQKVYATLEKKDYESAVLKSIDSAGALPADASKILSGLSIESTLKPTGKTRTILGIAAEEQEIRMKMELPPGAPGAMYLIYRLWSPQAAEFETNLALKEIEQYTQRAYEGTNPTAMVQKIFGQTPGFGEGMAAITKSLQAVKALLEVEMSLEVPGMVEMLKSMGGKESAEASAALVQFIYRTTEISAAPVDTTVFAIPRDYAVIPMNEALQGFVAPAGLPR